MKGKSKYLGLAVMAFALAMVMAFGVKLEASAYQKKGHEFYNKLSTGNGKPAQVVKYVVTKEATGDTNKDESKDGECIVIGCESGEEKIIIQGRPQAEDGPSYKTVGISDACFKNNKDLEYVQFNDSKITDIPVQCFYGCSNLKTVLIQDTDLKTIGSKAFYNCKKLKSFTCLSNKLTKSRIKSNAFKNVKSVKVIANGNSRSKKYAKWIKSRGAKNTTYEAYDD